VRWFRLKALAGAAAGACLVAACGAAGSQPTSKPAPPTPSTRLAHPQAVQPVAGEASSPDSNPAGPTQAGAGLPASGGSGPQASGGSLPASSGSLPQPQSLSQVRAELRASGLSSNTKQATLTPSGMAIAPVGAPAVVQQIINAGNQISHLPYRFGGGHGSYEDTAYDCSGSLSFVFIEAGLLNTTVDSSQLMSMGQPGRGKWVTIFANPGHTFMYVAGLRFDTVALAQTGSRWSSQSAGEPGLSSFIVRHPPGL
jgi:hypothetical protein